jgi:hypothetical protein
MKQRGVGEYAIEMILGQIELEEILLPDFAATISARHSDKVPSAFQTYRDMAEFGEDLKVTPRAAAKIEYRQTPFTLDVLQHRCDVLANVVIASAFPELFGVLVVIVQRVVRNFSVIVDDEEAVRERVSALPATRGPVEGRRVAMCYPVMTPRSRRPI